VAWVNYDFIGSDQTYHSWNDPLSFVFWYSPTPNTAFTTSQLVCVNSKLAINNGSFCSATSRTPLETWVGLYEKAYAKFRQWLIMMGYTSCNNPPFSWNPADVTNNAVDPDNPVNMDSCMWGGNPLVVSAHLVGGVHLNNFRDVYQPVPKLCGGVSNTTIYSIIKKCFCFTSPLKKGAKTNIPVTAWTYPDDASLPEGGTFSGTGITANHSYSVLGIWENGGKYYIVLRDTYGPDPSGTAIFNTTGSWDYMEKEFELPHYTPPPGAGLIAQPKTLPFSSSEGVFCIEGYTINGKSNFEKYFQTIGWITKT
jgi:hypothetical protein